jgi:hypothetical protein
MKFFKWIAADRLGLDILHDKIAVTHKTIVADYLHFLEDSNSIRSEVRGLRTDVFLNEGHAETLQQKIAALEQKLDDCESRLAAQAAK